MTKFHFKQAKKQHDDTIMTHMKEPIDNQVKYTQLEIEKILTDYWGNIMRKRNTNTMNGQVSSAQRVINSIAKKLPLGFLT